ncbi:d-3-phosphoglycerate dehydrogenase [hydrocarbon metagenome]|uniref:D-3-phosphoglycerate dehydrogenase n=1 Tax=hydrocarbon metagenome TaxID=938273 RepID=A0A0W8E2H7_9ZZZZ
MNNICILDAKTLGEDTDLSIFDRFGNVSIYESTGQEEIVERIKDQNIIITNKVVLNESNLQQAPGVKLICIAATGANNIDLEYCRGRNITVANVVGYSTHSVVQHTFALLFYLLESLSHYDQYVKSKQYSASGNFTCLDIPFWEIKGKTWGIIGLGTIGKTTADIARAFGCRVFYYSTSGSNYDEHYTRVELSELLTSSDVVSIHAPLNPQTYNLIKYAELITMKKHALLLNLGRGGIVNEADLAKALDEGLIAGAGLDVLEKEPLEDINPLLHIKNRDRLIVTPHIAWASIEARQTLLKEIVQNIEAFLNGISRNVVN